jgi:hypothetical protein
LEPSKTARSQAAAFESLAAAAGTEIVAAEFFLEQLVAVDDADADLNSRFRRISLPAFAHRLESRIRRWIDGAWDTSGQKRTRFRILTRTERGGSPSLVELHSTAMMAPA